MDRAVLDAYRWNDGPTVCGLALDWLDLDDDELADMLASDSNDVREIRPPTPAPCSMSRRAFHCCKNPLPSGLQKDRCI